MKRIFALLLAMARGVDEPADPLYLLSEEFEGAVRPWADSEQRTSFWTMLEDGSLVTVSVYNTETGFQNNSLECRTAAAEWLQGETAEETIQLEGPITLLNHSITYTTYEAGVPQAVYTNAAGEAVYNRYQLADGRTAASDDTLPVLVTDDLYKAGMNIDFSSLPFYEGKRFTPHGFM